MRGDLRIGGQGGVIDQISGLAVVQVVLIGQALRPVGVVAPTGDLDEAAAVIRDLTSLPAARP